MNTPRNAMVLAAGLGKRMRPITDTMPKPLVSVAGKALIDWGLDSLHEAGVEKAVVNIHYLGAQLNNHLTARSQPRIVISDETEQLLDSGGGIVKALPELGTEPFLLLNADTFWLERGNSNLEALARAWDGDRMDILLLLASHQQSVGHAGPSDFLRDEAGRLRRAEGRYDGFIYAGAAILHPRVFVDAAEEAHSLNREFDAALSDGRLYGWPMTGRWITVGTPDAIAPANEAVAAFRDIHSLP